MVGSFKPRGWTLGPCMDDATLFLLHRHRNEAGTHGRAFYLSLVTLYAGVTDLEVQMS